MELVHSAALLHDDVVDHALTRRGRRTASAEVGRSVTVVLGNYLYSKAFGMMPDSDGVRHQLSAATTTMCSGEALELARRGDIDVRIGDYIQAAGKKTASLISACCAIGARLGGGHTRTTNSLATYGMLLGLAFQIRDDCIDLTGGEKTTGKGCCRDFEERNATLPLILAIPSMEEGERERVKLMFDGREPIDTGWLAETVKNRAGIARSMQLASDYSERAAKCLVTLPDTEAKESMRLLTAYSVERVA
jgi:octaprenyl-diphosphate synthase